MTPILLVLATLLAGCRSLPEKITILTKDGEFDAALALLEEKGAGAKVSPELEVGSDDYKKAMDARSIYAARVVDLYGGLAEGTLAKGMSRAGLDEAIKAQARCTWSPELAKIVAKAQARCDLLDRLTARGGSIQDADVEACRGFVVEAKPSLAIAVDDEPFRTVVRARSVAVADFEASRWLEAMTKGEKDAARKSIVALGQLDIPAEALAAVGPLADDIARLPLSADAGADWPGSIKEGATLLSRVGLLAKEDVTRGFRLSLPAYLRLWFSRDASSAIAGASETKIAGLLEAAEDAIRREPGLSAECGKALAAGHLRRASKLARLGSAAAAGLAHLARATELDGSLAAEEHRLAALATLAKLPSRKFSITITSGSGASPEVIGPLFYVSTFSLRYDSDEDVEWIPVPPDTEGVDAIVHFERAERAVPSVSDLSAVSSKYFSHMQSVPNPQKSYLESRLAGQKVALNMALSNYNSAVSTFNYNPTQWTLNAVNYAENNYEFQRNTYNSIVNLYNSTPSTVEEPVYLPYTYFEGTMRLGFRVSGQLMARGRQAAFAADKTDSHYVRINTRYTDINSGSRQDVRFPVTNIGDRLVTHLVGVGQEVSDAMAASPLLPADPFLQNLTQDELACVAYLFHPFKKPSAAGLGVPGWARTTIANLKIARPRPAPPELAVKACDLASQMRGGSAEKVALLRGLTCRIDCASMFGDSSGSGALISSDGLILTAAHVVRGSSNVAVFNSGALKGEYKTEVVFIDDKSDVAVIRAKGLQSPLWFPVRFARSASAGESILAIGYPAKVNDGAREQDAVSSGIVSSVRDDGGIVAALTVASGNSGGPLIDAETGEIIGVVSAVVSPGIDKGYASSGYWCKGVAATHLTKALGLVEKP